MHTIDHVAKRIKPLNTGRKAVIHLDSTALCHGRRSTLSKQVIQLGDAPGGVEHFIKYSLFAALIGNVFFTVDRLNTGNIRIEFQGYALLLHLFSDELTNVLIEATQKQIATVDLRHLAAQAVQDARKLRGDVATTHHGHTLGKRVQIKQVVGDAHMFTAWQIWHEGLATHCHQNMAGRQNGFTHRDLATTQYLPVTFKNSHPGLIQDPLVDTVQPADFTALVISQCGPVKLPAFHGVAIILSQRKFLGKMATVRKQLLGHTADIHTGAPEKTLFDNRNAGTMGGSHACGAYTT